MNYPEYVARFYDIIYDKIRAGTDTEFYLKEIEKAEGKVLEIGTGTGRFFSAALKSRADMYGIDISQNMMDVLLTKIGPEHRDRVSIQGATDFRFPFTFNLIIAPFRVYSHLLTVKDQLLALNNAWKHLDDNGRLIFDLYIPDPAMLASGMKNVVDFEGEYEPGRRFSRTVDMKADIVNQVSDINMIYQWDGEDGNQRSEKWNFKFRFYFRYEIEHLIELSELTLEKIYGDFNGGGLQAGSREFIVICRK